MTNAELYKLSFIYFLFECYTINICNNYSGKKYTATYEHFY